MDQHHVTHRKLRFGEQPRNGSVARLLLAHAGAANRCPLTEVKRKSYFRAGRTAFGPDPDINGIDPFVQLT